MDIGARAQTSWIVRSLAQHFAGAEHGAIVLHVRCMRPRNSAVGVPPWRTEMVEPREREIGRVLGQFGVLSPGSISFGRPHRRRAAETTRS